MWTRSHSKVIKNVKKEAIWNRWSEVNSWHEWVPGIEYCQLDKPFQAGSRFILKPKDASAVTVQLVSVKKDHNFTGCTRFFGATLYDTYEMQPDPQGVRLTVTLKVEGPLGFLWRMLVVEKIANNLPLLMENLAHAVSASSSQKTKVEMAQPNRLQAKKPKLRLVASTSEKAKPKSTASVVKKTKKVSASALKKTKPIKAKVAKAKVAKAKVVKTKVVKAQPIKAKVAKAKVVKAKVVKAKAKPTTPKAPKKAKLQAKSGASSLKKRPSKSTAAASKKPKPKTK